jgi:creatinine amidohydrolase
MILGSCTWQEVRDLDRELVCVIPTGSLEQHGPHLPLLTDTLLSTKVCELAETQRSESVLLYPGVWLGCSSHHMAMAGTCTASVGTYVAVLSEIIESALAHGFRKFLVINGHGGNTEANGVALRELKASYSDAVFAHAGYYALIQNGGSDVLKGPLKSIRHACEAETSMMLHLFPDLVRLDRLRDDGLSADPPPPAGLNVIHHFDEITEEGSWGSATFAEAETGRVLIEAAIAGVCQAIDYLRAGYSFR